MSAPPQGIEIIALSINLCTRIFDEHHPYRARGFDIQVENYRPQPASDSRFLLVILIVLEYKPIPSRNMRSSAQQKEYCHGHKQ